MPANRRLTVAAVLVPLAVGAGSVSVAAHADGDAGYVGPPHTLVAYDPSRPCAGSGPTPATGWCSYYTGATSGPGGATVALSTAVCRLPGLPGATLVADDGRQADFAVGVRGYDAAWTWSGGRSFSGTTSSIDVPGGTCVQWSVSWAVVDDAGKPLAPGSYYLSATPLMEPSDLPATADVDQPQTFTVH